MIVKRKYILAKLNKLSYQMKKSILALTFIITVSVAIYSCSEKEEKKEDPAPTTSTTGTTGNPVPVPDPLGTDQIRIDTIVTNYVTEGCTDVAGLPSRWSLNASQASKVSNKFVAMLGKQPATTKDYTIITGTPAAQNTSNIQLSFNFDALSYVASSGIAKLTRNADSTTVSFKDIVFTATGGPNKTISGNFKCQ